MIEGGYYCTADRYIECTALLYRTRAALNQAQILQVNHPADGIRTETFDSGSRDAPTNTNSHGARWLNVPPLMV